MTEFTTQCYAGGGDDRHELDVFTPTASENLRTAVLILHGGAFVHGDRTAVHARAKAYAARGITAIAVGYRLLDSAPWPAQVDDVRAALEWTTAHADELGIDEDRIVLQGHSAGAQLAMVTAGKNVADGGTRIAAVVGYFAPLAMALAPAPGILPAQMLFGPEATEEAAEAASPISYIGPDFPTTVLVHGAGDRFIPAVASLKLYEALAAAGVTAELHLIAAQDHEFDMTPRYTESSTDAVVAFLRAQVIEPDTAETEVRESNPFVSMPPPGGPPA